VVDSNNREGKLLGERVERLRSEKDLAQLSVDEKDVQLRAAMDKITSNSYTINEKDAHVWWAYVWHELRRQEREDDKIDKLKEGVTDYVRSSVGVASYSTVDNVGGSVSAAGRGAGDQLLLQSSKLQRDLAAQGVELAHLRQVLLQVFTL
jgi:hypothetical protein